jgi:phage terminase large subunit-like protein
MIRREWLRYYERLPERTYWAKNIQSWDTASKDGAQNDWSVCTTWMILDKSYYLIDLTRGRYDYPRLKATAIALVQKYRPHNVLIEDASTGTALAQELKSVHFGSATRLVPVERDKIGTQVWRAWRLWRRRAGGEQLHLDDAYEARRASTRQNAR